MTRYRHVQGNITETTGGSHKVYSKKNIEIHSHGDIIQSGKKNGVSFGEPKTYKFTHPEIVEIQFLDEKDTILKQSAIKNFGGIMATDILYGKKVKIKIITKNVKDGTKISFNLKGETKSKNQDFFGLDKLIWNAEIKGNIYESAFFEINPIWYSEDFESYNYVSHKTEIKADDLNSFYVKGVLNAKPFELPEKDNRLKPIAYLRNYEELIGLFNTDESGSKNLQDNYENKFISSNSEILKIAKEFSEFITNTKQLTIEQIKMRVEQDAKRIWDGAVKQVQSGKLDDRPLYWTRNKMQVRLKSHYLFEKDIDFKKSIVRKGTELEKIIQIFEEKSRNYTGIDFSKTPKGKKKLLISGFDTFVINPEKSGNVLQSNPSGVNALSLHGKTIGNYYIQTFVYPVRYKDFDEFKNGKGVVETFFQSFINEVDMIITVSQGSPFRFDVDRFPGKNRGGFMDNMFWGDSAQGYNHENFKQLIDGKEFYETTLPFGKIVPDKNNPTDTFEVYFNQTYNEYHGGNSDSDIEGTILREKFENIENLKAYEGSGGDYLSNEIFYRVAKMRSEQRPTLETGHLHIPKIQEKPIHNYKRGNASTEDINPKINELITQIKAIIIKI